MTLTFRQATAVLVGALFVTHGAGQATNGAAGHLYIDMTSACFCFGKNSFPNIATLTSFEETITSYSVLADWGEKVIEYPNVTLASKEQFEMPYSFTQDGSYSPYANVTNLNRNLTETMIPMACNMPWVVTGGQCQASSVTAEGTDNEGPTNDPIQNFSFAATCGKCYGVDQASPNTVVVTNNADVAVSYRITAVWDVQKSLDFGTLAPGESFELTHSYGMEGEYSPQAIVTNTATRFTELVPLYCSGDNPWLVATDSCLTGGQLDVTSQGQSVGSGVAFLLVALVA